MVWHRLERILGASRRNSQRLHQAGGRSTDEGPPEPSAEKGSTMSFMRRGKRATLACTAVVIALLVFGVAACTSESTESTTTDGGPLTTGGTPGEGTQVQARRARSPSPPRPPSLTGSAESATAHNHGVRYRPHERPAGRGGHHRRRRGDRGHGGGRPRCQLQEDGGGPCPSEGEGDSGLGH